MKFMDKINSDYANGKFADGLTLKVRYSNSGNTYCYFTSEGFYESFKQASNALNIFSDFIKEKNIEVTEICDKEPMWIDSWRNEHGYNPAEKAPSFKSKW